MFSEKKSEPLPLAPDTPPRPGCGDCGACPDGNDDCPEERLPFSGWKMAAASVAVFWIPLLVATAGAMYWQERLGGSFLGAAVGFAAGMLLAWIIIKLLNKARS